MAFYEASEKILKSEIAAATTESTRLGQFFSNVCAEVTDLQERLGAMDAVVRSIVEDSCVSLGQYHRSLVENSRAGHNKSVREAFRAGFIGSQFHSDASINGIALHFSEGAASNDGDVSTKSEDVADPFADPKVIES